MNQPLYRMCYQIQTSYLKQIPAAWWLLSEIFGTQPSQTFPDSWTLDLTVGRVGYDVCPLLTRVP